MPPALKRAFGRRGARVALGQAEDAVAFDALHGTSSLGVVPDLPDGVERVLGSGNDPVHLHHVRASIASHRGRLSVRRRYFFLAEAFCEPNDALRSAIASSSVSIKTSLPSAFRLESRYPIGVAPTNVQRLMSL